MNAKKLVVVVVMVVVVGLGANVLRTAISRSQAEYHPPPSQVQTQDADKWLPASATTKSAAEKSIIGQLDAFNHNDYVLATTYQAASLRGNFRTPEDFKRMIQRGYPQFAHYKTVLFGHATASAAGGMVAVPVILTGQDGVNVSATYYMHRQNGDFKVSGVMGGGAHPGPRPAQKPPTPTKT